MINICRNRYTRISSRFPHLGAGDQGLMFGYATDETEECMPLTVVLAHKLNAKMAELRRNGGLAWARPDSKTQVTCEYKLENGACVPTRVHTIVISIQHSEDVTLDQLRADLMEKVVKVVIPAKYLNADTVYHLQVRCWGVTASGRFILNTARLTAFKIKYTTVVIRRNVT